MEHRMEFPSQQGIYLGHRILIPCLENEILQKNHLGGKVHAKKIFPEVEIFFYLFLPLIRI